MAKKKINYTKNSSLDADEFDSKYVKVLISTRLDEDVLKAVKTAAAERGIGYQTLINQVLKDHFLGNAEEEKIRRIVRDELKKTG
jgi:predicted DNA binding CopG/RHH family protein